jgi:hypothetical protein
MKSSDGNASNTRREMLGVFTRFLLALCVSWYYPGPTI